MENIVICFCKHPEPGMVKSRLAKTLGDRRAANIYKILLNKTLLNITQNNQATNSKIFLYCYPDIKHPFLSKLESNYPVTLKQQSDGDLGEKMFDAIKKHVTNNNSVVLIGTDCIEIDSTYIETAFDALKSGKNSIVLGPTYDGGYAMIGVNEINKSIFENINWSTDQVLEQTIAKLQNLEWPFTCLPKIRDIDRLDDYQYFSNHRKYRDIFN